MDLAPGAWAVIGFGIPSFGATLSQMERGIRVGLFLSLLLGTTATLCAEIRVGMIGLDTSHVVAFTRLLNDATREDHVPGARVTHAFKGGSADVESSYTRVDGFAKTLVDDFEIELVDSVEELVPLVDAIMVESVDGRPHLEQARPGIVAGLPTFIDKPLSGSLRDALAIAALAESHETPVFSASSYRFYDSLQSLKATDVGTVKAALSYGPAHLEPHHPDLYWYAVHPTEALYTILGAGCEWVTRVAQPEVDVVTGVWSDGRVGTLYGLRTGATPHQVTVFGSQRVVSQEGGGNYRPLVVEIVKFFETGEAPVSLRETVEMFAFMEAADESKRRGGAPVRLDEVMAAHAP